MKLRLRRRPFLLGLVLDELIVRFTRWKGAYGAGFQDSVYTGGVIEGQMPTDGTCTVFLDMFLNEKSDPSKQCCNGARPVEFITGFCFRKRDPMHTRILDQDFPLTSPKALQC